MYAFLFQSERALRKKKEKAKKKKEKKAMNVGDFSGGML